MKKILIGNTIFALSFAALCSTASAESNNWTGFYGGLSIGGMFNDIKINTHHLGLISPDEQCNTSANHTTSFSGLQGGYSRMFGSMLMLGVEGDFTYNKKWNVRAPCVCETDLAVFDQSSSSNQFQGSARGRIGYALRDSSLLPFVTGGVSFANIKLGYTNEGGDYYSQSKTQPGWLVGAGLEWSISPEWSLRGEYAYQDYGKVSIPIQTIYGLSDPNGGSNVQFTANTVKLSVNYWID